MDILGWDKWMEDIHWRININCGASESNVGTFKLNFNRLPEFKSKNNRTVLKEFFPLTWFIVNYFVLSKSRQVTL